MRKGGSCALHARGFGEAVLDLHRLKSGQRERSVLPPGRYRVGVAVCREDEVQPAWRDRFDAEHVADVHVGAETVLTTTL